MKPATRTNIQHQYINSDYINDRFLDAIQSENGEIPISLKYSGLKRVDNKELIRDGLDYFLNNKKRFENEFEERCSLVLGRNLTHKYMDTISNVWYDGMSARTGEKNFPLLKSIEDYLIEYKRLPRDRVFVLNKPSFSNTPVLFRPDELNLLIGLNRELVTWALEEWIHEQYKDSFSTGDVYIRRGYMLNVNVANERFFESNYMNSYSLSISISEQFCQVHDDSHPTLINVPFGDCIDRILFFSPFIKNNNQQLINQNYEQLELALIPPLTESIYKQVDFRDGVTEYNVQTITGY